MSSSSLPLSRGDRWNLRYNRQFDVQRVRLALMITWLPVYRWDGRRRLPASCTWCAH